MENSKIAQAIDKRLSQLGISEEMEKNILAHKHQQQSQHVRPKTLILAVCLCVMIAVPALAITVPAFRGFLRNVRNDIVQLLKPVELACESNGIRMEVIAAANDDESVIAFITMKDMTGGEIKGDVDLYDYGISGLNMSTHYAIANDEPQTALLCIMANGGSGMNGKKVTLQVTSFLSGRKVFDAFDTGLDLSKTGPGQSASLMGMNEVNGGSGAEIEAYMNGQDSKVLVIGQQDITLPNVDFVVISGIGIIDGKLHVQAKWPEKMKKNEHIDDYGFFYLENDKGGRLNSSIVYFRQGGIEYTEEIFDIADLTGYRLYADAMTTNERFVKGNWQVTFPISAVKEPKNIDTDIDFGSVHIDTVSISPLGVTLSGTGEVWPEDMKIDIKLKDGSLIEHVSMVEQRQDGMITRKYIPIGELMEPDEVAAVIINGVEVTL